MHKVILKCGLSPGDIVMLTAAVRDLHAHYPHQFLTDVRTACPDLWENNPHITRLQEDEPGVETIECSYPLINRSNQAPYHCIHGFIEFLSARLRLRIKPTVFKGDIHLSRREKSWYSQVHEATRADIPFWVVSAGGKYDISIKWWATERYQQVIDHFSGKIQFVQVGQEGHHHPRLNGVIDLRGRTSLRELVRLVYHSQGVLCSVTALMHLAAAIERKPGQIGNRPCVVVAGGREPPHWEAYPGHQFIHTNGALACCANGGCWKDRVAPLGDGDDRDRKGHLCVDVVDGLPRCMNLITAEEVIRRIEVFYRGGVLGYLTPQQRKAARTGIDTTARNDFDRATLTLGGAGMACERFIPRIPDYPDRFAGRGIVICGGGVKYFVGVWVCVNMLRRLKCSLPIQLWYLGPKEMDDEMQALVAPLNVECIDASHIRKRHPIRILGGWQLKPYAIVHSPFKEVLLLDADNVPVVNPDYLFETERFRKTGAVFWPDFARNEKADLIWRSCGIPRPAEPEFESGQILVDKQRCWRALGLALWYNENSDLYYRYLHGDKETFHLAFAKLHQPYALVQKAIHRLECTMCQHDFDGRRIFQHRNMDKWNLFLRNKFVADFWYEPECRQYVAQLQRIWDGRASACLTGLPARSNCTRLARRKVRPFRIDACMISCVEREEMRRRTVAKLAATDWRAEPAFIQVDEERFVTHQKRQAHTTWLALRQSLELQGDYVLLLEDDLEFNHHLRFNLEHWPPLRQGWITLASLYNPNRPALACDVRRHFQVVDGNSIYGSQALLLSRSTVRYVVRHWAEIEGMQDIKISRLARRLKQPILYHAPSLVQHVGLESVWGGGFHEAADFDPIWRAEPI